MAIARTRGEKARKFGIRLWLSAAEVEQLKDAAGEIAVATWLRDLALGQPSKPRPRPRKKSPQVFPKYAGLIQPLAVAVARVGNNLNQIARTVNLNQKSGKPMDAVFVANQLAQIRREMREELRAVSLEFLPEVTCGGKNL